MTHDEKVILAQDAEAVLNNPAYQRAFQLTETAFVSQIKRADLTDDALVTKLMIALQLVGVVQDTLEGFVADAKYDAMDIGDVE